MTFLQDFNFDFIELDYPIHCSRHIKVTYILYIVNTIDVSGFTLLSTSLLNHSIAMTEKNIESKKYSYTFFALSNVSSTIAIVLMANFRNGIVLMKVKQHLELVCQKNLIRTNQSLHHLMLVNICRMLCYCCSFQWQHHMF